jgi:hypothetical protein
MDIHGFVGVPRDTFEISGRAQMVRLLENGLVPESRVLDIGCGVLRLGYWSSDGCAIRDLGER